MKAVLVIFMLMICLPGLFSQEEIDSLMPVDSTLALKTIVVPEFKLIDSDTISLGENDEMICDSYSAIGVPWVYDALHSFNRRRMDYFGGYMNVKINAGLERVRSSGFKSDVKKLYIQIDPLTLSVYWIAVVGPSEDGNCYACIDSRGSAGGGLGAVNKQIPGMHGKYPGMKPVLLMDFNENVIQCYEGDGTPLSSYCTYVNIRQKFYKYATDCYNAEADSVIVQLDFPNTGIDTYKGDDVEQKQVTKKVTPAHYKKYKVRSGDTLSQIAQRHHTTVTAIKRLNHLRSDRIDVGQVLKIP
jgi:LysM repeat protein